MGLAGRVVAAPRQDCFSLAVVTFAPRLFLLEQPSANTQAQLDEIRARALHPSGAKHVASFAEYILRGAKMLKSLIATVGAALLLAACNNPPPPAPPPPPPQAAAAPSYMVFFEDRKSTRLNSSHTVSSYAVFCLKK